MAPDLVTVMVVGGGVTVAAVVMVIAAAVRVSRPVDGGDAAVGEGEPAGADDDLVTIVEVVAEPSGYRCGIECSRWRLDALWELYAKDFERSYKIADRATRLHTLAVLDQQVAHIRWDRYAALYLVPDGGGAA